MSWDLVFQIGLLILIADFSVLLIAGIVKAFRR
ncbi:putative membrane protein [Gordonia phage GTE5]|uniref:Uncharacterized protein n=2 Tax=Gruunavirus TaxID=2948731 RepID=A0A2L1IXB7_9CAUD|nr:membrane protein [Gordonia phage GTE5]YP_010093825.1 membrane protein [Gordonia phage Flapper]AET09754.1 putative membrane protein [Gordonia phage GTE5]AVD99763.1 hypothetical protein SEA_FLAPPER_18 [Gordonia phage Flapper]